MKVLICKEGCEGEYSANPNDYWYHYPHKVLKCSQCGADMVIVKKLLAQLDFSGALLGTVDNMKIEARFGA